MNSPEFSDKCQQCLDAVMSGQVPDREMQAHMEHCPACIQAMSMLASLKQEESAFSQESYSELKLKIMRRLEPVLEKNRLSPTPETARFSWSWFWQASFAIGVVLVVCFSLFVGRQPVVVAPSGSVEQANLETAPDSFLLALNGKASLKVSLDNPVSVFSGETAEISAPKTDSITEEALKERWKTEQEKKRSNKPAYAYRSPSEELKLTPKQSLEAFAEITKNFISSKSSWITFAILLAVALGFYVFFIPKGSTPENISGKAIIVDQYIREGTIKKISGAMVEFVSKEGETFVLSPAREGYRMPRTGTKFRISLVPFRKGPNNTYLARIRTMRQIDAYSVENGGEK